MSKGLGMATIATVIVGACLRGPAAAQTYLPGPPPTVGDIQHQTVSPYNPSRTVIGIGEKVNCWIDPSTWQDTDIYVDGEGNQTPVSDSIGTITWMASGAGTVYPVVGNGTTLTANLTDADDTVAVQATIPDSGTKGIDPPIVKTLALAIKTPTALNVVSEENDPSFATPPPPINVIGFFDVFHIQILPPTVDFGGNGGAVTFRENLPGDKWTWPNGLPDNAPATINIFGVSTITNPTDVYLNGSDDLDFYGPKNTAVLNGLLVLLCPS